MGDERGRYLDRLVDQHLGDIRGIRATKSISADTRALTRISADARAAPSILATSESPTASRSTPEPTPGSRPTQGHQQHLGRHQPPQVSQPTTWPASRSMFWVTFWSAPEPDLNTSIFEDLSRFVLNNCFFYNRFITNKSEMRCLLKV